MTTRELIDSYTREEGIALFNAKKSEEEIYDLCVAKGLTDDFETFKSEAQKVFTEKFSKMSKEEILAQIEGAELTDEQLEQIAGGKSDSERNDNIILGTGIGVAAAGAFAAVGFTTMVVGLSSSAAAAAGV